MKRGVALAVLLLLVGVAGWYFWPKSSPITYGGVHYASHQNKEYYGDIEAADTGRIEGIRGVIVSHHLLMADDIAETFASMASEEVRTVVIVGPDHFRSPRGKVSVSRYPFETPWGRVEPNLTVIDGLIAADIAVEDEYPFEIEHSVSSLVPYVRYHFPSATFVPILLDRTVTAETSEELGAYLSEHLPDDALVIASVDFSHHLGTTEAKFHDAKSVASVLAFDYGSLPRLEVDSPASLAALLQYLDREGAKRPLFARSTNSAEFLGLADSNDVTSYLFAGFGEGEKEGGGAISILAGGDVMLGRDVGKKIAGGVDVFEHFSGVEGNFLKGFDMFAINLEGPITDATKCQAKAYSFAFDPSVAKMLADNSVTHATLSNNHANDCYRIGVEDTRKYLDAAGIRHFGGGPLEEDVRFETVYGKNIAFIGVDRTTFPIPAEEVYAKVRMLSTQADYVIAEVHWGSEYQLVESALQREFGHNLVDNGANVVIGHHPHVVQPFEFYKGAPIFYSLGNLVFDQGGKETSTGIAAGIVFHDEATKVFIFPYTINKTYQPEHMSYADAQTYCKGLTSALPVRGGNNCMFEVSR